jgi:CheY-like chemotaxis protein
MTFSNRCRLGMLRVVDHLAPRLDPTSASVLSPAPSGMASVHPKGSGRASDNGGAPREVAQPLRVLVVDDHAGYRSSMVEALRLIPQLEVAGEADSSEHACQAVVELRPDVVLMDLTTPGLDGMDTARRIRRERPETKVIILVSSDGPSIQELAIDAGASEVILKGTPLDDVVGIILNLADSLEPDGNHRA